MAVLSSALLAGTRSRLATRFGWLRMLCSGMAPSARSGRATSSTKTPAGTPCWRRSVACPFKCYCIVFLSTALAFEPRDRVFLIFQRSVDGVCRQQGRCLVLESTHQRKQRSRNNVREHSCRRRSNRSEHRGELRAFLRASQPMRSHGRRRHSAESCAASVSLHARKHAHKSKTHQDAGRAIETAPSQGPALCCEPDGSDRHRSSTPRKEQPARVRSTW